MTRRTDADASALWERYLTALAARLANTDGAWERAIAARWIEMDSGYPASPEAVDLLTRPAEAITRLVPVLSADPDIGPVYDPDAFDCLVCVYRLLDPDGTP